MAGASFSSAAAGPFRKSITQSSDGQPVNGDWRMAPDASTETGDA
jgi:hypothetical protein